MSKLKRGFVSMLCKYLHVKKHDLAITIYEDKKYSRCSKCKTAL